MRTGTTVRRVGCLLAICVMVAALGSTLVAQPVEARAAPVGQIDLGGLFGDENEPDENETDGGRGEQQQASGTSLPVVLLLMALAAVAGAYGAIRVRRLLVRLRGWGRDMRARL